MTTRKHNPFPVDPEILNRIRPMKLEDAKAIATLHHAAMGNSLWGKLGVKFLFRLYKLLIDHPNFIGFVYEESGRVRGFIAGSDDGQTMLRDVFRKNRIKVCAAAFAGALRKPSTILSLIGTFLYFGKSRLPGLEQVKAESMFCSFEKDLRGKRISGLINKVLFDELAAKGHRYVKITTEADNAGALRQLTSWGFEQQGRFRFYGKEMIAWRLDLAKSERVESVSRF